MAVTNGTYSYNETKLYNYLRGELGLSIAISCGILANVEAESSFNHQARGDNNTSYGLFQWHNDRYEALRDYCAKQRLSYSTVEGQLAFFKYEWYGSETRARGEITKISGESPGNAFEAARRFCTLFERPSDAENKGRDRGVIARDKYYDYYTTNDKLSLAVSTWSTGKDIVDIAKQQVGAPVVGGSIGPHEFDDAGLVYFSYNEAGYPIPEMSAKEYIDRYMEYSPEISLNQVAAGDLVYYKDIGIGIATGDGKVVVAWRQWSTVQIANIGTPTHIVRILPATPPASSNDTNTSSSGTPSNAPSTFNEVVNNDPYLSVVSSNIDRVEGEGFDVGYLIDMTHGEEFKFYVPEFEESAGANWDSVNIVGRSVNILSYSHTNSRVINIALELYAGVGMYVGNTLEDSVSKLHRDANFLKSLEYPDYTNPITRPPATVHLILGSAVNMIGVVSDVSVNHLKPVDHQNRSMYLKVNFKVTQVANNPPDWKDIKDSRYAMATSIIT